MSAKIRLAYDNLAASESATVTASSALTSFPASNAVSAYRSQRWKPKGSFRITSANSKIYINDGSDKTITLTSAVYETGTALATHATTQLNASSSNWTVTYSTTTGIFTFARSAGTKTLRLTETTDAAWDTFGFTGVSNQDASAADVRRNHTSERLAIDLGAAADCNFFAVYGAADSQFTIADTATCVLKASASNDYDTATLSVSLTVLDSGIYKYLDTVVSNYRYWWFDFIDRENPDGPESFSLKVWLGDYVEPTTRNVVNGFAATLTDRSTIRRSENGVLYSNRKTKFWRFSGVNIEWLSGTDREMIRDAYAYCGQTRPLFVSLDADAAISSDIAELTKLVTFDGDPEMTQLLYNYYGFSMSFSEVVG